MVFASKFVVYDTTLSRCLPYCQQSCSAATTCLKITALFARSTLTNFPEGNKRRRSRYPKSKIWRFVLYKKNIGTADAISLLCKKLHLKNAKAFHYAGTKDKRGITVQVFCAL